MPTGTYHASSGVRYMIQNNCTVPALVKPSLQLFHLMYPVLRERPFNCQGEFFSGPEYFFARYLDQEIFFNKTEAKKFLLRSAEKAVAGS